mgnify:FL=1
MMGQGFGNAVGDSLAKAAFFAVLLSFVLGVVAGVTFPALWDILKAALHASTA